MEGMNDRGAKRTMQAVVDHCERLAVLAEGLVVKGVLPVEDNE